MVAATQLPWSSPFRVEDLEFLEETLDVMGSAALPGDIRDALAELSTAGAPVLSKDDALRLIAGR
jgi:hypothetical protein